MASLEDLGNLRENRTIQGLFAVKGISFAYPTTPPIYITSETNTKLSDRTYIFQSHHLPWQQPAQAQQQRPGF